MSSITVDGTKYGDLEMLGDHKGEWYKDVVKEKQESCVRKKAKSWLGSFIDNSLLN
jgi:hypothetical protein